jgi:hypothetical protein
MPIGVKMENKLKKKPLHGSLSAADVIDVATGARSSRHNEFIFDWKELDLENSPFENMCKFIEANSDLKIEQINEDEMYVGDAFGFRITLKDGAD